MTTGTIVGVCSAVLGALAAALVALLLHSAPLPQPGVLAFNDAWDDATAALDRKSNRLPLRVKERIRPLPETTENLFPPAPAPPPAELVQLAPGIVAKRLVVESNLCTRHGLRKVWVNSRYWKCRR